MNIQTRQLVCTHALVHNELSHLRLQVTFLLTLQSCGLNGIGSINQRSTYSGNEAFLHVVAHCCTVSVTPRVLWLPFPDGIPSTSHPPSLELRQKLRKQVMQMIEACSRVTEAPLH